MTQLSDRAGQVVLSKTAQNRARVVILWVNCGWIIMKMCNFAC